MCKKLRFQVRRSPLILGMLLALGLLGINTPPLQAEETYILAVPGNPALQSKAILNGRFLTILDAQGTRFDYVYDPKLDSPDGAYLGYYSPKAQQFIRWPANDAGNFLIGNPPVPNWRPSQMQIHALRPINPNPGPLPPRPQDPPLPGDPPGNLPDPNVLPPRPGDPVEPNAQNSLPVDQFAPAVIAQGPKTLVAAYVTSEGNLHFCRGWEQDWKHKEFRQQLVPGAPLLLLPDHRGTWPLVYTVSRQGQLVLIENGQEPQPIAPNLLFPTSAAIAHLPTPGGSSAMLVDQRGRLWQVDLSGRQQPEVIERRPGRYIPGSPVAVVGDRDLDVFLVDAAGSLVQYVQADRKWYGPTLIRQGYQPGSHVTAAVDDYQIQLGSHLHLGILDRRGRFVWLHEDGQRWQESTPLQDRFVPGGPLELISTPAGLRMSAITSRGELTEWLLDPRGQWLPQTISQGFMPGAPVVLSPLGPHAFVVDPLGRMIASSLGGDAWNSVVLLPNFDFSPRLVSRRTIANTPIDPARILLTNSHAEELIVQINDPSQPGPGQLNIPPGQTVPYNAPRDAGAVLEEVYLVPSPMGPVEEVHRYEIPPQTLQTLVVYVKATTYKYIDKRKDKPEGALPSFDLQTPMSLGVIDLPPGNLLQDGTVIDVYKAAEFQRNPGAARWFQPPMP